MDVGGLLIGPSMCVCGFMSPSRHFPGRGISISGVTQYDVQKPFFLKGKYSYFSEYFPIDSPELAA
jgi:hypothetical protein